MITDVKDITSFKWATVAGTSPVSIKLDGDTAPLALVPDSLVDPAALTIGDRVRVELSLRKAVIHGVASGSSAASQEALVTSLTGFGQPVVDIYGVETTVTDFPFDWVPTPGDRVVVERRLPSNDWAISSQIRDFIEFPRRSAGKYMMYYDVTASSSQWGTTGPRAYLRNGFVQLTGLLSLSAVTIDMVLFTLPVGYRPDVDMAFLVDNSAVPRAIVVKANGDVRLSGSSNTINGYYSLDKVMFPVAGKATWTYINPIGGMTPAFLNGWANIASGTGPFGACAYWIDEYGFMWFRGLAAGGTTTDTTPMFSVPSGTFDDGEIHHATASNETLGGLSVGLASNPDRVLCKTPSSTSWVSLAGVAFATVDALALPGWKTATIDFIYAGGWSTYLAPQYPPFMYIQRDDGLVFLRGLIDGGALNAQCVVPLPLSCHRDYTGIYVTYGNQAYARMDLQGGPRSIGEGQQGSLWPTAGSTAWFTVDGIKWIPD